MPDSIKDGRTCQTAIVDDHGRLWVNANMVHHLQHHATYHKNSYILDFDITLSDTSEQTVLFLKNIDSTKDFEIYDVEVSSDAAQEVNAFFNDGYTSGGTAITPLNLNLGSGNTLGTNVLLAYEGGAADMVTTGAGSKFHTSWISASEPHHLDFEGGLIVTNGKSISLTVKGASSDRVNVTLKMAHHSAGYKL